MVRSFIRRSWSVLLAGAFVACIFVSLPAGASAADAPPVPQAPTFSVIAASETLPFTRVGSQPTQVAVLTGNQTIEDASWETRDQLALAAYEGQKIRVLARRAGVNDPAAFFDANYDVRDTYESAVGHETATNPAEAVIGKTPPIASWATGWKDYAPGLNVTDNWKTPENAIGPIGGDADDPYSNNTVVVVLGDHGKITMTFSSPIYDGAGYDFAVFENGFNVGTSSSIFGELGRVLVSSNGTDFVEFDTGTLHDQPVGGYAGFPANRYGGTAGRDLNSYGTPYDLSILKNKPAVRNGLVDLDNITEVKIVDIVGDGNDLDSFGRPIYDAFPTMGSGGFDLRGIGALNQKGVSVQKPLVKGINTTTVSVNSSVSPGPNGNQDVELQVADNAEGTGFEVRRTGQVSGEESSKRFTWEVGDIASGSTKWFRVAAKNGSEITGASEWVQFEKVPATIGTNIPGCSRLVDTQLVNCPLYPTSTPGTDGPVTIHVELSANADYSDPVTVGEDPVSGLLMAKDLNLRGEYWFRASATYSDGVVRHSEWRPFQANDPGGLPGTQTLMIRIGDKAVMRSRARPGSNINARTALFYSTVASFPTDNRTFLPERPVPIEDYETSTDWELTGLDPALPYYSRVNLYKDNYTSADNSSWAQTASLTMRAVAKPVANVVSVVPAGNTAAVRNAAGAHTYGEQEAVIQYTTDPSQNTWESTETTLRTAAAATVNLENLQPDTTYWTRAVLRSTHPLAEDFTTTSSWFEFKTPELTDGLGTPLVVADSITRDSAVVEVPVSPGAFDRSVLVEYTAANGGPQRTTARLVTAAEGDTMLQFDLAGLAPATEYSARVISTAAGVEETSGPINFKTDFTPAGVTAPSITVNGPNAAVISAEVAAGDLDQEVTVEYTVRNDDSGAISSSPISLEAGAVEQVTVELDGLASRTSFRYRVVATSSNGDRVAGEWARFDTPGHVAPTVAMTSDQASVKVGAEVTLTWSVKDADSVTASGAWSGALPAEGSKKVQINEAGTHRFELNAEGAGGIVTGYVNITAELAATEISVNPSSSVVRVGTSVTINAAGLVADEVYEITLAGLSVASGKADDQGLVKHRLAIPSVFAAGNGRVLQVRGSTAERTGLSSLHLVSKKKLTVRAKKKTVKRSQAQRLTVLGLAPGEQVRITAAGKQVSPTSAQANAKGIYRLKFRVKSKAAKQRVVVRGLDKTRIGKITYRVRG